MKILQKVALSLLVISIFCIPARAQIKKVTPEYDPEPDRCVQFVEGVRNAHPRLLFTPADIAKLRKLAQNEGKDFFGQTERYLKVCRAPKEKKFLRNSTDAQCHGLWRMPTAAIHFILTEEQDSFDRAMSYMEMLLKLEHKTMMWQCLVLHKQQP